MEKLQQTLRRAETLPEVEAELTQRVAVLSKVPFWVPGGRPWGGPVPMLSHHAPACAAQSTQECRHGGRAAGLRWERSLSVRQPLLLCHPYVNFPPVLSCVLCVPRMHQLRVTAAELSQQLKA